MKNLDFFLLFTVIAGSILFGVGCEAKSLLLGAAGIGIMLISLVVFYRDVKKGV
jgi:hypothetical protein